MKKIVLTLITAVIFGWQGMSFADSSVDALIQKLQDKGILTDQEASQLKDEVAAKEQTSEQTTFKSLLPDWLNNIKFTGDMRLRYQYQRRDDRTDPIQPRNRGRVRARLQFEDQVNDKVKVVFGIATDGQGGGGGGVAGFARSNNQTFGGNTTTTADFGQDIVVLHKAYVKYTPWDTVTIQVGKMDNPIWEPQTSFLWDPNITPEGGSIQLQKKINDYFTPWATAEWDVMANNTPTSQDAWMTEIQAGAKGNITDKVYYKAAGLYFNYMDPKQGVITTSQRSQDMTNSDTGTAGSYTYTFDRIYGGTAEFGMNDPLGELLDGISLPDYLPHPYIPQVGVFASLIKNGDVPESAGNKAWQIGGYMGNSALNGWGTWRFISAYKVIERNAWLDALPDYDFYTGDTDVAGWRNELDVGLMKNVYMGFNIYQTRIYKPFVNNVNVSSAPSGAVNSQNEFSTDSKALETLVQADINIVF